MQRNKTSFLAISAGIVLLLLLFYFVIPTSHESLNKKGIAVPSQEPQTAVLGSEISETSDEFGVIKYRQARRGASSDLAWLTLTYDETSWGHSPNKNLRSVDDLLRIAVSQYPIEKSSIGLLTSSLDEYNRYKEAVSKLGFAQATIFMHPGFQDGPTLDRKHRHDAEFQTARRAEIAKLRNYLMLKTLRDEAHIVWVDADVFHLDNGIVNRIIRHVHARDEVGIITARCSRRNQNNYDLNAWRGTREGPRRGWDLDQDEIDAGEMSLQGQYHVDKLIENTSDDDLVPLDTVGATLLYLRSSLIWRGLNFPHQYVVGTRWMKDGWDGIESEGLCYRARGLKGGQCMVLGGTWHVEHTMD